ncbi:formylglycine-generating enzyme family protein [Candidatus Accumulibacter phosphatis]|uniref:Nitrite reductase accessory protein NirV n=1 Tax=Candidatus Accumulibacter phosphatis TaxID=327160 RepID=A0A5S4EK21_9PROT|nr:formylglycine-generating enzyme family protein [Candidatus Accumulibacter phosphatis]TMQ75700.1 Nitrite reductase accessory protein NirV [Candidatus Accumulibacter phosphatis]
MSAVFDLADWQRRGPDPFPPPWASAWGDDRYGVWAELRVASEVQRLRWIEPGHFRMGDESQPEQQVPTTIASGFWLADSACTQALWQAVMGSNPSHFSERNSKQPGSPQHPVEQVSWNDVVLQPEGFLVRLQAFTAGAAAGLPSEAEWEYACRAGTQTAYSFGDTVTGEEVNYWSDKGARMMTVAVRSLLANPWGLYEMHGNVWEWCADASGSGAGVAERALRGGSWSHGAGSARSALRGAYPPGFALQDVGFRFALRSTSPAGATEWPAPRSGVALAAGRGQG